jgi:methionyl-tRNA formyltransferase
MNISVLCSAREHPVFSHLTDWVRRQQSAHRVELVTDVNSLSGGELLFLISCNEVVHSAVRSRYRSTLVIHASDLPLGRGWSPHVWQVIEGSNRITVTLLEATESVDSGDIWTKEMLELDGSELFEEINDKLFRIETALMDQAVRAFPHPAPTPQDDRLPTYYRKRTPADSRIDPTRSIAEQFNQLRVADSSRFPAFFDHLGHRYFITLSKESIPEE